MPVKRRKRKKRTALRIVVALAIFVGFVGMAASGVLILQAVGYAVLGVLCGLAMGDMRALFRFDGRAWRDAVAALAVATLIVIETRVTAAQAFVTGAVGLGAGLLWATQDPGVFAKMLGLAVGPIDDGMGSYRKRRTLSDVIAEEMASGQRPPTELPPLKPGPDPDAPLDLDHPVSQDQPKAADAPRPPTEAELLARLAKAEADLREARLKVRGLQEENHGLQQEALAVGVKGSQEIVLLRQRLQDAEGRARRAEERATELERAPPKVVERPATPAEGASDRRFQEAKRAFARRFHPDFVNVDGMERKLRVDIFKEFWGDLERIERGGEG